VKGLYAKVDTEGRIWFKEGIYSAPELLDLIGETVLVCELPDFEIKVYLRDGGDYVCRTRRSYWVHPYYGQSKPIETFFESQAERFSPENSTKPSCKGNIEWPELSEGEMDFIKQIAKNYAAALEKARGYKVNPNRIGVDPYDFLLDVLTSHLKYTHLLDHYGQCRQNNDEKLH